MSQSLGNQSDACVTKPSQCDMGRETVYNVDDQNMVVFPIVRGRLAMLMGENLASKYNVNEMKSM